MKKTFLILIVFVILITSSCKKEKNTAQVVRDCTGTYLRIDNKDYQVCNLEKVEMIADGELVTATYRKINKCNGSANGVSVCERLHVNEGWIEVIDVK